MEKAKLRNDVDVSIYEREETKVIMSEGWRVKSEEQREELGHVEIFSINIKLFQHFVLSSISLVSCVWPDMEKSVHHEKSDDFKATQIKIPAFHFHLKTPMSITILVYIINEWWIKNNNKLNWFNPFWSLGWVEKQ